MEKLVLDYIRKHHMIPSGSLGILAVSGGADSMCLMHILHRLSETLNIRIVVCHVIHGIRGEEAEEDAAFVKEAAEGLGLECRIFRRDVPALARETGLGLEEAGRMARYECFDGLCNELGAAWIALAHQQDDQAETILFHMLRGTGIRGLRGMRPVQGNRIRPLLPFSRTKIEAWMREQGLGWRTDSTNLESEYSRNRLRNVIMPELCRINSSAKEHLLLLAKEAEELYDIQKTMADRLRERYVRGSETESLFTADSLDVTYEPAFRELILQETERLAGQRKDLSRKHVTAVQALFSAETGKRTDLPYGLEAVRTYSGVLLRHRGRTERPKVTLSVSRRPYQPGETIPSDGNRKMIDAGTVKGTPFLRTPEEGDRIVISQDGGTKSLNRFFTDRKIPRELRGSWPVVADEEKILWVVGLRLAECCKVTENTEEVYLLQAEGEISSDPDF